MANERKYELTGESKPNNEGHTIYRIKAVRDFTLISGDTVHAGDLGGYIECEENLSHEGSCWVDYGSEVFGSTPAAAAEAGFLGTPRIIENAYVKNSTVSDNVTIGGNAFVSDSHFRGAAKVGGDVCVIGNSFVGGSVCIDGNAFVQGEARVSGGITVKGAERIYGEKYKASDDPGNEFDLVLNDKTFKALKIYRDTDNTLKIDLGFAKFGISDIETGISGGAASKTAAKCALLGVPIIGKKEFLFIVDRAVKNIELSDQSKA